MKFFDISKYLEKFLGSPKWIFLFYTLVGAIYFFPFLFKDVMIFGTDWLAGGYPRKVWMVEWIRNYLKIPLWDPFIRNGMPTIASFWGDLLTPSNLLQIILPVHRARSINFMLYLVFAGFGTYIFLRSLRLKNIYAFFGGIFYMWSASLVCTTYGGHFSRMVSMVILPWLLYFIYSALKKSSILRFIIAGGVGGLAFLNGHFQMTYYAFLMSFAFFIYYVILNRNKLKVKGILRLVGYAGFGVFISFLMYSFYIFPVLENLGYAARGVERGYEYAVSWAHPPLETLNLLFPHFSGYIDTYWGWNGMRIHMEYMGILPILLAVGSLIFFMKDKWVKFFLGWLIFSLFFAFGGHTPVYKIFYYLLPGIKKFRAPSLIFYQVNFSLTVLGTIFFSRLKDIEERKIKIAFLTITGFLIFAAFIWTFFKTSMIGIISGIIKGFAPNSTSAQQKLQALHENYPLLVKDTWIALGLGITGLIILYLFRINKIPVASLLILIPIHLFDTWRIEKDFLKEVPPPKVLYAKDEVVEYLQKDTTQFKVFPLQYKHRDNGLLAIHGIKNVAGMVANPLQRFQDFIGAGHSVMFSPMNLVKYPHFIDLLNIKYIIARPLPTDLSRFSPQIQARIMLFKNFLERFELDFKGSKYVVYRNPSAFEWITLFPQYKIFSTKEEVLRTLEEKEVNFRKVALLEKDFVKKLPALSVQDTSYKVEVLSNELDKLEVKVVGSPGILVVSENWHPGWKAWIDGEKTEVFPVDYTLRGIFYIGGEHKVVFQFTTPGHRVGFLLTIIGFILFFTGIIGLIVQKRIIRKNK